MNVISNLLCGIAACLALAVPVSAAEPAGVHPGDGECCKNTGRTGQCNPLKRGWCGKRKGDWYGARRPVTSVDDARRQLSKYFSGQSLSAAGVAEKPWRYEADVLDPRGVVVDRVMIDKRSGRVRSIY